MDNCNFWDLGYAGPRFTWTNKRPITSLILERIDRCFANPSSRILYIEAVVTHLLRTFSDHCLVLIELDGNYSNCTNKLFHFQTMSMHHTKFPRIVKEAWSGGFPLSFAISSFTNKVKQWNFEVFGNIFARKKRVLVRLNGATLFCSHHQK